MARLSAALIVVSLTTFLLGVTGEDKIVAKRQIKTVDSNNFLQYACTNGFIVYPSYLCNPYTTTLATTASTPTTTTTTDDDSDNSNSNESNNTPTKLSTTTTTSTTSTTSSSTSSSSTTTVSGTPLENAHWCQLSNGTYLSLNQTFNYNDCTACRCLASRSILCASFKCMATYCIDGSTPITRAGQCCQQCNYDNTSGSCLVSGIAFPTGALLLQTSDNVQCWCESGTVECRKSLSSVLTYWSDSTTVYVVVIVICVILILGTLLCCAGGIFFYYYYYKNQQTFQDAYAQYYSNAGWQPMTEDGQVIVDGVAQEKQAEAEQQQYEQQQQYPTGQSEEYIPPPYALYNGVYVNQQNDKEQHFT